MVYEVGYGLALLVYDAAASSFLPGCSVTSAADRRTVTVIFTATVSAAFATVAITSSSELDAITLIGAIQLAASTLGRTSIPVPSISQVQPPLIVSSQGAAEADSAIMLACILYAAVAVLGMLPLLGGLALWCYCGGGALQVAPMDIITANGALQMSK